MGTRSENSIFCLCIPKFRVGDEVLVTRQWGDKQAGLSVPLRRDYSAQITDVKTVPRPLACCNMVDMVTCGYTIPKRYSLSISKESVTGTIIELQRDIPGEFMEHSRANITAGADVVAAAAADKAEPKTQP